MTKIYPHRRQQTRGGSDPRAARLDRTNGSYTSQLPWLGVVAIYMYLNLFSPVATPFLFEGDQNYFWAFAQRMLYGELPYRDFFQFTTPGADLFFLELFRTFGPDIWVADMAIMALGVALCGICFTIAARIMPCSWALLTTGLFVVLIYGWRLDATHHWFSLLAILGSVRILMSSRAFSAVVASGVLLGIASFFTQAAGLAAAAALAGAFAWERLVGNQPWRRIIEQQLVLLLSFGATFVALSAYFLVEVGWRQLWYSWVVYPLQYALAADPLFRLPLAGQPLHRVLSSLFFLAQHIVTYVSLMAIYPVTWWLCWRKRRTMEFQHAMPLMFLSLVGAALLLTVITRPNWGRIDSVFLPALILLVRFLATAGKRPGYLVAALWACVIFCAGWQITSRQRHLSMALELPAGRTIVLNSDYYEKFSWLREHTQPGEWFLQTNWLNTYFPLKLRSGMFADALGLGVETRPEWVALAERQVASRRIRYILWTPSRPDADRAIDGAHDRLGPFRAYLREHYVRVHVFSDGDEIWSLR